MRSRTLGAAVAMLLGAEIAGCSSPLGTQYEYDEQLYLTVRGAATVIIDTSIPALIALRGAKLDPSSLARVDQTEVRHVYEAAGCHVVRVGQPWRRDGRRFIQVRLDTDDVRTLGQCGMLAWSTYTFEHEGQVLHFVQRLGASASGNPGKVNWDGSELVAFRLHLPSRILSHNVRRIDVDEPGDVERGNILTWEQTLADRRAGKPITMDVRLDSQSILYRTFWLFGGAFTAAVLTLALIVWLVIRLGRRQARP